MPPQKRVISLSLEPCLATFPHREIRWSYQKGREKVYQFSSSVSASLRFTSPISVDTEQSFQTIGISQLPRSFFVCLFVFNLCIFVSRMQVTYVNRWLIVYRRVDRIQIFFTFLFLREFFLYREQHYLILKNKRIVLEYVILRIDEF